jgi:lactose/cellobiose-specific phosphotransferase system IIC component
MSVHLPSGKFLVSKIVSDHRRAAPDLPDLPNLPEDRRNGSTDLERIRRRAKEFRFYLQESFVALLPYLFFTSTLVLLNQVLALIFPDAQFFLAAPTAKVVGVTQEVFPLVLVLSMSYHLAQFFEVDRFAGLVLALIVFLMIPSVLAGTAHVEIHASTFEATIETIILPILSLAAFAYFARISAFLLRRAPLAPMLARSLALLLPFLLAFVLGLLAVRPTSYFIRSVATEASSLLLDTPQAVGVALWSTLSHLLWFVGLHGTSIMSLITGSALLKAEVAPGLTWQAFLELFVGFGGVGSVLGLAVLLCSRDGHMRFVAALGTPFAVFNISEVLIFGIPVVFNMTLIIPFLIAPIINFAIGYYAVTYGLFAFQPASVSWITPLGLNGFLRSASMDVVVFQVFLLSLTTLIYAPFVHKHSRSQSTSILRDALRDRLALNDTFDTHHAQKFYDAQSFILRSHRETRKAIEDILWNELTLHYQPKIDVRTQRCTGFEALLRLQFPDGTIKGPYFLDTLEKAGFAIVLDRWVCDRVLRDITASDHFGLSVAINLHPDSLANDGFVTYLIGSFGGRAIEFEIVERGFSGEAAISRNIARMGKAGLRLSVDDFGSGYSNLGMLTRLPVNAIKLDRSLLIGAHGDAGRTLYATLTGLCGELGYHVVAEGVETLEDYELVATCGANEVQGWYFAKAMPFDQALQFAANAS